MCDCLSIQMCHIKVWPLEGSIISRRHNYQELPNKLEIKKSFVTQDGVQNQPRGNVCVPPE